ncbi:stress-response a/b barrel domain-containing protein up3 [Quercus suber]|uniref:Stress-response a/b barrel domain-containing protein up3 n=1 Tax=Quercus suber TaxID=58331 RepID=A0AAW0KKN0_QUESU
MAFDWVAPDLHLAVTPKPKPGFAVRVSFLKLKEEEEGKDVKKLEILGVLKEMKDGLLLGQQKQISELSYGEKFSPERSKGYSLAYLAVFPGHTQLEDSNEELGNHFGNQSKREKGIMGLGIFGGSKLDHIS